MPVFTWFLFALEALVSFFVKPASGSGVDAIVVGTDVCLLLIECMSLHRDREIRLTLFLGLVFRMSLFVWDLDFSWIRNLPNSGADSTMYAVVAEQGYLTGAFQSLGGVYSRFIAFFYIFFGVQPSIAQYVNILLSYTLICFILRTLESMGTSVQTWRIAAKLLCLLPNLAIMNSILLRETPIAFLLAVSAVWCLRWVNDGNWFWFVASALAAMIAATMHSGALAVVLGECVFAVLYNRSDESLSMEPKLVFRALLVVVVLFALFSAFGDTVLLKLNNASVDSIVERSETSRGGSGYTVGINTGNTMLDFIINTPIRMFYFVATPLPWQWRGISDIIAFVFSALFYIQTYRIAIQVLRTPDRTWHRKYILLLMTLAVASAFMFGWGVSNAGTALRHREKFTAIYVLLYALCRDARAQQEMELHEDPEQEVRVTTRTHLRQFGPRSVARL